MLTKTAQTVFIPGVAGRAYRPYSRTCPPPPTPPPPKRWVNKTVCGTYTRYAFYATTKAGDLVQVQEVFYTFTDYPTQITTSPAYDPSQPSSQPVMIGQGPYCMQVRVYE
jgi:hypothetical protein